MSLFHAEFHIRNVPFTVHILKCFFSLLIVHENEFSQTDIGKS